jgi:hypothetical protein
MNVMEKRILVEETTKMTKQQAAQSEVTFYEDHCSNDIES